MDINRFTEKAQQALQAAQNKATRLSHQQIDVEHMLAALLGQEGGLAPAILNKADVPVHNLRQRLDQELARLPKVTTPAGAPDQLYVTGRLNRLMVQAEDEAKRLKDDYISVEHLLLAMTDDGGLAGRLLKDFKVTRERLMQA
ncbi:MAG: type VI secretion system ATPase TssH, partial [Acidobacteriales bacterium]